MNLFRSLGQTLLVAGLLGLVLSGSAGAVDYTFRFDFNGEQGPTQSGYEAMNRGGGNDTFTQEAAFANVFGPGEGVTVRFAGNRARQRGAVSGDFAGMSNLLRDWYGSHNMNFSLSFTLPLGTYRLTSFHHDVDTGNFQDTFNVAINDAFGTRTAQGSRSQGATPDSIGTFTGNVSSDSSALGVSLSFSPVSGTPQLVINGFHLEPFGFWDTDQSGLWSDPNNWMHGHVADGAETIASFRTVDVTGDVTVTLDSGRTLSGLVFGNADPATPGGWLVGNGGDPANTITLAATASPMVVGELGTGKTAEIAVALIGTGGMVKDGPGTLVLSADNSFSGPTIVRDGALELTGTLRSTGAGQSEARGYVVGQGSGAATMLIDGGTIDGTGAGTSFYVGDSGTAEGTVIHQSGNVAVNGALRMAVFGAGTRARYEMHGGTLDLTNSSSGYLQIGRDGQAEFIQTGGEVHVRRNGDALIIAANPSSMGRYEMHAGQLHVTAGRAFIGMADGSRGEFIQYSGTVTLAGNIEFAQGHANSSGRYEIHDGSLSVGTYIHLGRVGAGEFVQYDGTVSLGSNLELAQNHANSSGRYEIYDGTLDVGTYLDVGRLGAGTFLHDGGTVIVAANVNLASQHANATGRYEIHSGTLNLDNTGSGFLQIGRLGTGEFVQTGGIVTIRRTSDALMVGGQQNSTGLYEMSGGELRVVSGSTFVGQQHNSQGTFRQYDGTVTLGNLLSIGHSSGNKGLWEIHDGELNLSTNTSHQFYVGNAGEGRFVQTGGTVTQPAGAPMYLANSSTGRGYYDISGGTLDQGSLSVGHSGGYGEFTQTGGEVFARRDIRIARGGGTGSYAISDGTLTVSNSGGNDGRIIVGHDGSGSTGTFNQSGGVVDSLGGIRLANGSNITGTYDMSGGELRTPEIARGSGTAAFLWSGGTIRPRTGGNLAVTTPLTLTGTEATFNSSDAGGTARTITVSAAVGGGGSLTKAGAGTLLLSATNTYAGQTTVEAGTVHVTGTLANNGSGHVRVAAAGDVFGPGDPTIVRRIAAGGSFAGLGSQIVGAGTLDTTADLPAGTNQSGGALDVAMAWRTRSTADTAAFPPLTDLLSDVLRLDGMADGGQTDPFVLQMSYDPSLVQPYHDSIFLAWLDEGAWVNAAHGNFGLGGSAVANYAGSWTDFVADFGSDLNSLLGSWGVDATASSAWAVLNHNSQFAVLAVPEPGTWGLLLCAFACALLVRRRR